MILKRLRDLREDNDMTQREMADILGISQRYYSNLENGTRTISAEILIQIADYYNVSLDYICNRTNSKTINKKARTY